MTPSCVCRVSPFVELNERARVYNRLEHTHDEGRGRALGEENERNRLFRDAAARVVLDIAQQEKDRS